jgi:RNA polymerase sigma-54 factor
MRHVGMELGFDLDQEQRARNLPRLIEANFLLHLSTQELETVITQELSVNPALELDEAQTCPVCGKPLDSMGCPTCSPKPVDDERPTPVSEVQDREESVAKSAADEDEFDYIAAIAADVDTLGQLAADARSELPEEFHLAIDLIINGLDERGFLTSTLDEIAAGAGITPEQAEWVLRTIQELAPPGVAARSLRESLLLQIQYLRSECNAVPPLVETIIDCHLSDLGAHRYHGLARTLHSTVEEVSEAHEFIRGRLSPHPLQDSGAQTWRHSASTPLVAPDVLITIIEDELHVEVVGHAEGRLRVNGLYEELATQLRRRQTAASEDLAGASDEDRAHIRDSVQKAKQFISKLQQRRETLLKISLRVCQMQEEFLRGGIRELRPLTRSDVAMEIGVHESTVSRATANKYVMLPNRKVIPFSDFFTASLGVKDVIKELIEKESANGQALSDMRIRELLLDRGYRIARRTVAKYRGELKILPSTIR